ncbi:hypothetical protein EMIT0347P_140081 [Pseudomonas sp. IT-347P]
MNGELSLCLHEVLRYLMAIEYSSLNEIQNGKSVKYTLGSLSLNDDVVNVTFEVLDIAEITYLSPMVCMDRFKFF